MQVKIFSSLTEDFNVLEGRINKFAMNNKIIDIKYLYEPPTEDVAAIWVFVHYEIVQKAGTKEISKGLYEVIPKSLEEEK